MEVTWTKEQMTDTMGRGFTQSLFLETNWNTEFALFTYNDREKIYKGKKYPSLKEHYLHIGDPTEYEFATTCLLGWKHWKRLLANKLIRLHIDEWREELEVAIRSEGIRSILEMGADTGNYMASKYAAEKGWEKTSSGRPVKKDKDREDRINKRLDDELSGDVIRMEKFK